MNRLRSITILRKASDCYANFIIYVDVAVIYIYYQNWDKTCVPELRLNMCTRGSIIFSANQGPQLFLHCGHIPSTSSSVAVSFSCLFFVLFIQSAISTRISCC